MPFTYDISTSRGRVRALIPDRWMTDSQGNPGYVFDDAEIDYFLIAEGNVIKKATALALETMATEEVYIQKRLKLLDLTTDGPAEADALLNRAAQLRAQAAEEEAAASTVADFDWAEWVTTDFAGRERVDAEALRNG